MLIPLKYVLSSLTIYSIMAAPSELCVIFLLWLDARLTPLTRASVSTGTKIVRQI